MLVCFSRKVRKTPRLEKFCRYLIRPPYSPELKKSKVVGAVGWGRKHGSLLGRWWANRHQLPYYSIEEGFIAYPPIPQASVLKNNQQSPYSLIVDDVGIYYDATQPSKLENILKRICLSPEQENRARATRQQIVSSGITKYNHLPSRKPLFTSSGKRVVLVVEQVILDKSIRFGGGSASVFKQMFEEARSKNPDALIVIKTHPFMKFSRYFGYLTAMARKHKDVELCDESINPFCLLSYVDEVYTVSSQIGFEALLMGKTVHCYGSPFYSGWGLTIDKVRVPRRKKKLLLDVLFYGAYIEYPTYLHPDTQNHCQLEQIIEHIQLQQL